MPDTKTAREVALEVSNQILGVVVKGLAEKFQEQLRRIGYPEKSRMHREEQAELQEAKDDFQGKLETAKAIHDLTCEIVKKVFPE